MEARQFPRVLLNSMAFSVPPIIEPLMSACSLLSQVQLPATVERADHF